MKSTHKGKAGKGTAAVQFPIFGTTPGSGNTNPSSAPAERVIDDISSEPIKQFNDLIIAQHEMNIYERRIFISLLENLPQSYAVAETDKTVAVDSVWIDVQKIMDESGLIGQSGFSELKKATTQLIKHVCKVEDGNHVLQISLLSSAEYYKREGKIEIRVDPKLLPYLIRLKEEFQPDQLSELMQFQSRYTQCFYELLKRESKKGSVLYIDLARFRSLMGIEDVYERYNDVKRKVIIQAQKDLLSYPDVAFSFEEKKVKGKVEGIYFYLKRFIS